MLLGIIAAIASFGLVVLYSAAIKIKRFRGSGLGSV